MKSLKMATLRGRPRRAASAANGEGSEGEATDASACTAENLLRGARRGTACARATAIRELPFAPGAPR